MQLNEGDTAFLRLARIRADTDFTEIIESACRTPMSFPHEPGSENPGILFGSPLELLRREFDDDTTRRQESLIASHHEWAMRRFAREAERMTAEAEIQHDRAERWKWIARWAFGVAILSVGWHFWGWLSALLWRLVS